MCFRSTVDLRKMTDQAVYNAMEDRNDGKELFYLSPDFKLMSVAVKLGPSFESGTPVALMDVSMTNYGAISSDGQRVLLSLAYKEPPGQYITIVTNWTADLPRE